MCEIGLDECREPLIIDEATWKGKGGKVPVLRGRSMDSQRMRKYE